MHPRIMSWVSLGLIMKYELIGENNLDDIICQILKNRGVDDPQRYLSLDESCCNKYEDLDNMKEAV